jgi:hypothetical protein
VRPVIVVMLPKTVIIEMDRLVTGMKTSYLLAVAPSRRTGIGVSVFFLERRR